MNAAKTYEELLAENEAMRWQLEEATDTIHAIRTGQVDALVVQHDDGAALYSLKTADQTYRVFIEKMNEGAVTLNEDGIIVYCNSMFAQMAGMPLSQVLGRTFETFIPENSKVDYRKLFNHGWQEDTKLELPITGATGLIPCQLSVTTLQMDDGLALSIIVTDLSYQKEIQDLLKANNERLEGLNAALEKSNYDLLQFASVASHDLQEPLRKIMVFSGMLKAQLGAGASSELLERINVSSLRMKGMIADILAYSRLEQDGFVKEPVKMKEVVAEILDDFEILIAEKCATVLVESLPVVPANRGQMRQAFQNLISNALKFSRPGIPPVVRISGEDHPETHTASITISDNGIGFNDHYREKIFMLFHRLNTRDNYEGSGIGLAVTKKIIDKHEGHISATAQEGNGSTFRIELPVEKSNGFGDSGIAFA
jgi:two-component system CheB/CheR fusion protein